MGNTTSTSASVRRTAPPESAPAASPPLGRPRARAASLAELPRPRRGRSRRSRSRSAPGRAPQSPSEQRQGRCRARSTDRPSARRRGSPLRGSRWRGRLGRSASSVVVVVVVVGGRRRDEAPCGQRDRGARGDSVPAPGDWTRTMPSSDRLSAAATATLNPAAVSVALAGLVEPLDVRYGGLRRALGGGDRDGGTGARRDSPPGSCAMTVFSALSEFSKTGAPTTNPAASSAAIASEYVWPTTDGTRPASRRGRR